MSCKSRCCGLDSAALRSGLDGSSSNLRCVELPEILRAHNARDDPEVPEDLLQAANDRGPRTVRRVRCRYDVGYDAGPYVGTAPARRWVRRRYGVGTLSVQCVPSDQNTPRVFF